jgi:hypothetical protein
MAADLWPAELSEVGLWERFCRQQLASPPPLPQVQTDLESGAARGFRRTTPHNSALEQPASVSDDPVAPQYVPALEEVLVERSPEPRKAAELIEL